MAGRIPQSFVDELLDRVDIVELIDGRVKLKKSGKNYMACCPFHDEKTPSFSVNAEKQFYHCFGCGASGNAIGFLMEYEHRSFLETVEILAQQQGMEIPREEGIDAVRQKQRQGIYGVLEKVSGYYQEQLRSHPQASIAQDYLRGRGLTGQIAHSFGIGYAPPGWDNLTRFFASDASASALLSQAGMLVEKEGSESSVAKTKSYDRFRHRIMFPIRDVRGRVIGFGGRVLNDDKPKYLNSPETEVFHKGRELYGLYEAIQANRHLDRILVVEGYMDVVALAQYGISFATATLGTAASENHLEKAFRYAPEVVFCFDGDEAGRRAARRALEVSLPALTDGHQVRFLFLPEGEDPDTFVRKKGTGDFLHHLERAMPLSEFLFDVAGENVSLSTPEGRAKLINNLIPSLRRIPVGAYKLQLKNLLASKSQTDINYITALLHAGEESAPDPGTANLVRVVAPLKNVPGGFEKRAFNKSSLVQKPGLMDEAVSLLLQQPSLLELCEEEKLPSPDDVEAARLLKLVALLRDKPEASLNKILGLWQSIYGAEDSSYLYHLAARESLLDETEKARQFIDILARQQSSMRNQQIEALINKAKTQSLSGEEKLELSRMLNRTSTPPVNPT